MKIFNKIDSAKSKDIISFLRNSGIVPVVEKKNYALYHAPYRTDRHPSMMVWKESNTFKDMATEQKGDIIELVKLIKNCDFKQALEILNNDLIQIDNQQNFVDSKINILEEKPITSIPLIIYLRERCIPPEVYKKYCKEVIYTVNDRQYSVIGFKNDRGGYELRNKVFKGGVNKDITCIEEIKNGRIYNVFEGFMDFLSFKTFYNKPANAVILNSAVFVNKAANILVKKEVDKVFFFKDADATGDKTLKKFNEILHDKKIVDMSPVYSELGLKDLNNYLIHKKKLNKSMKL